jgi:hypothetical protein
MGLVFGLALLGGCFGRGQTTDLVIEVRHSSAEQWQSFTLTCDPDGGTHPQVGDACRTLAELQSEDLAPPGPDQPCPQVYGGPQEAIVRGVLHGRPVDLRLSRNDGCQIQRWDKLGADVLPVPLEWSN